ncbi:putative NAD dependent epimerase/dehydratase [Talaromyces proteolyticus]|uniref:NAD dependent epimerase/dehydratase n=1 Tax=Talaromyces proteolyticus TaxID=1131652 RepID=A0AAD4PWV3_9EURO|nr:putative NAD dependent epimerase/dehydratase [Talaromyces proteolyticus]KAH8692307.1 putative NAD dependent epimerase/dehydratase [Talaromyces proteolyticus]
MNELKCTIPKGSWVLITGANGFLASHTAKQFLERGFKVRGTVRNLEKSSWLIEDTFKAYAERGDFQLVQVPDIAIEHAFDDAVKDVSAIAHIASVGGFDPNPHNVIPQVVSAVTSLLEAALKEPSVREFVYTSSIAACAMPTPEDTTHIGPDTWNDMAVQLAWAPPPYDPSRGFLVYMASKAEAEKALWKFVNERKPRFGVNSVFPSSIIGGYLNKGQAETPYAFIKTIYDGKKDALAAVPATFTVISNDVKDCALLHVAAVLDPEVKNERLPGWGEYCNWNDILAIMRRLYPDRKFIDDLPGLTKLQVTTDSTQSLALLKKWGGQKGWKPLEVTVADSMRSIIKWYP